MKGLFAITTYFNPCRYKRRRDNYDRFMEGMRKAGVPCITVECAFGDAKFELPESLDVIHIRSETLVWQKERLLNLAASWLPESCKYVAWLDCDILFDNPRWGHDLVNVLKKHKVAQVWETCLRLNADGTGEDDPMAYSFASVMAMKPDALKAERYDAHGHTGYGWAMRRSLFDSLGLYESAIGGSADHYMAHCIFGDHATSFCVCNALKKDPVQIGHLQDWGDRFYSEVQGSLGVVPGQIRHLWHGSAENRRYFLRMHEITDLGYNPHTDTVAPPGKPLEWAKGMRKQGLRDYFHNYFASRLEDGVPT